MTLIERLFGTHSEREIKIIDKTVVKIEELRDTMMKLSDDELRSKTKEFKERLNRGETLDDILPEAYAVVREASRRVLGMEHYRVQLIGGVVLHQGRIAEMKTGEGKANPLYTKIPTPDGWKTVGDIKVGDMLFDKYGHPTKVTGVYPQGKIDVYEVELKDGRKIKCAAEHLWEVHRNSSHTKSWKTAEVLTTKEIMDFGVKTGRGFDWSIPMCKEVQYAEQDLELDPYVLGCFLGDGCKSPVDTIYLSSQDEEIVTEVGRLLGANGYKRNSDNNYVWTFDNGIYGEDAPNKSLVGKRKLIKADKYSSDIKDLLTNTYCHDKYIPMRYKIASVEQRWELLQGLFDTDGNIYNQHDGGNRYNIQYSTTSKRLCDDVMEVIYSLGLSCSYSLNRKAGTKEQCKHDQYVIRVNVPNEVKHKFFRLSRKKNIAIEAGKYTRKKDYNFVSIVNIKKLDEQTEQVCFTVDNIEHLFLVGDYVVTHNTLVCTLPAYLNALDGKGVHVVTVNDYLAKRDSDEMGQIHRFLGLSVGCVLHDMTQEERRTAYNCDITYITNNELGFDYLRDNMAITKEQLVQRGLHYAIIDEIDSILIDEARTPLIISGQGNTSTKLYELCDILARKMVRGTYRGELSKMEIIMGETLEEDGDFVVDEKDKVVTLTDTGVKKVEQFFKLDNLADIENTEIQHNIELALRANNLMHKDKDYVVSEEGEILIVDEFTGRIMPGRRFSDGLHQAIEAKEKVKIKSESKTLATITFQNFFNKYNKKGGMTGTALTEEREFRDIYGLDVIAIPTNRPVRRVDYQDAVYKTKKEKYNAVVNDVKDCYNRKQPVLVGTINIDVSEHLSKMLKRAGIPHQVLNAKLHAKEAEIVALAGRKGAVTIATNMAGRGTDIKLEDGVAELGGLKIIGTERHESRRIDNQLRGRSGRQGDPGEAKFYISLEDDLMRLFGSEKLMAMFNALGIPDGEEIQHKMLSSAIEKAQMKIETNNYGIRKHLIDYDKINNEQREIIYDERRRVLDGEDMKDTILHMIDTVVENIVNEHIEEGTDREEWDLAELNEAIQRIIPIESIALEDVSSSRKSDLVELLTTRCTQLYDMKEAEFASSDLMRNFERIVLLKVIDARWMEHIDNMEHLRMGIGLQVYAQKDPVLEYKMEAYHMFSEMNYNIQKGALKLIFKPRMQNKSEA